MMEWIVIGGAILLYNMTKDQKHHHHSNQSTPPQQSNPTPPPPPTPTAYWNVDPRETMDVHQYVEMLKTAWSDLHNLEKRERAAQLLSEQLKEKTQSLQEVNQQLSSEVIVLSKALRTNQSSSDAQVYKWKILALTASAATVAVCGTWLWYYVTKKPEVSQNLELHRKRFSLCIGIDAYAGSRRLEKSAEDSIRIYHLFKNEMAFSACRIDLNSSEQVLHQTFAQFCDLVSEQGGDRPIATIYFAGHGVQRNGEIYLLPADSKYLKSGGSGSDDNTEVPDLGISVTSLKTYFFERMGNRGATLCLFVDCCRFDATPLTRGGENLGSGAAAAEVPRPAPVIGTPVFRSDAESFDLDPVSTNEFFIGYATEPGGIALEGLFANALIQILPQRSTSLQLLFNQVTREVIERSRGRQRPWQHLQFSANDFVL